MIHQIRGTSMLAALRPGHDYRSALDEAAALGFNLCRTFCGPLPWCGQDRTEVYNRLPGFLKDCGDRGLNAYLSYITEAGVGYDLGLHVRTVDRIASDFQAVVLREVANEPWHPTQGGRLSSDKCRDLAEAMGDVCAGLGAAEDDESIDYAHGDFAPAHLDRGRDKWNQVRRVRELLAISLRTGTPCLNQEPIGAAEASIPGKRESDPAFFYTLGALNRLFLGGNGVFHSESGLFARPLGPTERACAEAYLAGVRCWPGAHRLDYRNVGHSGSPVVSATFNDGRPEPGCTRSYSGIDGDSALNVTLGIHGDPGLQYGNGWFPSERIGRMAGVDIWRVQRG